MSENDPEHEHSAHCYFPRMREMDLNREVSVTMPAHVWVAFWVAYSGSHWTDTYASAIAIAAQEQILDPDYIKEKKEQKKIDRLMSLGILPEQYSSGPPEQIDSNFRQGYL